MNLDISYLLNSYRNGSLSVRQVITDLGIAAAKAPSEIWIFRLASEQLESYLVNLESRSPDSLPLYGIPFAIKDNIDLSGVPTTAACPAYAYNPTCSAHVVELLIQAGAIPIGKTNMDQFATGLVGVRSPYGAVPNKLSPGYISGGSSSGSAAALSYELVSFSLGTDTAGSGRIPAAFNELFGVKPSKGALSTFGVVPACRSLDCVSIFARNCADARMLFELCADYDRKDPYSRKFSKTDTPLPLNWKFAVPQKEQLNFFGNRAYKEAFSAAVHCLKAAGGTAVEIDFSPFMEAARLLYNGPWVYERYSAVGKFIETHPGEVLPVIRQIITPTAAMHPSEVFDGFHKLQELKAIADRELAKADLLLTPTAGTIYQIDEVCVDPIQLNSNLGYYTNYMNLLDYCAIAVPMERADGLPFGITLTAPAGAEQRLFDCCEQIAQSAVDQYNIAVFGAHLRGCPLHYELKEAGAIFVKEALTSSSYCIYPMVTKTGAKPALVRKIDQGNSCYCEIYRMSGAAFAQFIQKIPPPLGIGKVELLDGQWISGFISEAISAELFSADPDLHDWRNHPDSGYNKETLA
ncbi:MAG: allophanate hydrolase [Victivallales bacterium]|jgi:allophanate hydrolase|nr:allophanate hydrolase [Victivallales bacterium]